MEPTSSTKFSGPIIILLVTITGVCAWWLQDVDRGAISSVPKYFARFVNPKSGSRDTVIAKKNSDGSQPDFVNLSVADSLLIQTVSADEKSDIDQSATSWQNPFKPSHWISKGWSFEDEAMSCPKGPAEAAFRRNYRRLRVELDLEPIDAVEAFQVRLYAAKTKSAVIFRFKNDEVIAIGEDPKGKRILKQRDLDLRMKPGETIQIQLAATGNRLQVFCNGRRALICNQPAGQSGRDIRFSFASAKSGFRITNLRIEGE